MINTKWLTITVLALLMILSFNNLVYGNEINEVRQTEFSIFLPLIKNGDYEPCSIPPELIAPENGSDLDNLVPFFTWNNGYDPSILRVIFELSDDPTFDPYIPSDFRAWYRIQYKPGEQSIRLSRNLNEGLTLYWRVSFECDEGNILFSEIWSFTTPEGGSTLPAPQLLAPENGSTLEAAPVNLEWEAVPGAEEYQLVLKAASWTRWIFINDTHYTIDESWLEPGIMEWSVATLNDYAIGEQSEWWSFYITNN